MGLPTAGYVGGYAVVLLLMPRLITISVARGGGRTCCSCVAKRDVRRTRSPFLSTGYQVEA